MTHTLHVQRLRRYVIFRYIRTQNDTSKGWFLLDWGTLKHSKSSVYMVAEYRGHSYLLYLLGKIKEYEDTNSPHVWIPAFREEDVIERYNRLNSFQVQSCDTMLDSGVIVSDLTTDLKHNILLGL